MSSSASVAGSRADQQLRPSQVSDSDMDIDEEEIEPEEEVEVEEEVEAEEEEEEEEEEDPEEEDVAEEEEEDPEKEDDKAQEEEKEEEPVEEESEDDENAEENEEAEEDAADLHNSPNKPCNYQQDVERDFKSERHDENLGSGSSMTRKSDASTALKSDAGGLKSSTPSDEQSTTLKDSCLSFEDSKLQSSGKEPALIEDKGSLESLSEHPWGKPQPSKLSVNSKIKSPLLHPEIVSVEKTDICYASAEKLAVPILGGDCIGTKSDGVCSSGDRQTKIKPKNDRSTMASRLAAPELKHRSLSPGAEIKEMHKRLAMVCEFFAKGWCIKGKSCKFLHVKGNSNGTSKQPSGSMSSGSRESQYDKERMTLEPRERDNFPASQLLSSPKEKVGFVSSIRDIGGERLSQHWPFNGHDHSSSVVSGGNPPIFRSSFPTTGFLSSQNVSAQTRPLTFKSRPISLLNGSSSFSGPEPEGNPANHRTKVSSNDWEPSEPFRPSFVIPPTVLPSCGNLYDPFRDSIDKTNKVQQSSDDKNSSCSQSKFNKAVPEKNCETLGAAAAEAVATSVVEQNEMVPEKENSSLPSKVKDGSKRNRADVNQDPWHRSDGSSRKKTLKADRAKIVDDMDGEVRSDAGMVKESKQMRHFRTALIDTIKELLKPAWREGHISKDAHNTIVRKAVDKVLGSVQSHQLAADIESVDQYLSSSRPKIAKLVEGYLERYRGC